MTFAAVPRAADQLAHGGGMVVELALERALRVGERQLGGVADRRLLGGGADLLEQWAERTTPYPLEAPFTP